MLQSIGQAKAIETYKHHQLSLTSLICFIGTLQAIAVTFVVEHNPSAWRIGWDMSLLAAAYTVRIIKNLHHPVSYSTLVQFIRRNRRFKFIE